MFLVPVQEAERVLEGVQDSFGQRGLAILVVFLQELRLLQIIN